MRYGAANQYPKKFASALAGHRPKYAGSHMPLGEHYRSGATHGRLQQKWSWQVIL